MGNVTLEDIARVVDDPVFDLDGSHQLDQTTIQEYYDRMVQEVGFNSTPEQIIKFMGHIEAFVSAARRLKSDMEMAIIDWIEEHGDIEVDQDTRYYVGKAKTTKCRDMKKVGESLVEAMGGDLDGVFGVIKSEGWKHGAVKRILGEDSFNQLYFTEERSSLKTGKPVKLLKKANPIPLPKPRSKK